MLLCGSSSLGTTQYISGLVSTIGLIIFYKAKSRCLSCKKHLILSTSSTMFLVEQVLHMQNKNRKIKSVLVYTMLDYIQPMLQDISNPMLSPIHVIGHIQLVSQNISIPCCPDFFVWAQQLWPTRPLAADTGQPCWHQVFCMGRLHFHAILGLFTLVGSITILFP